MPSDSFNSFGMVPAIGSAMPNEPKTPQKYLSDALDLMVKAGWIRKYARNVKTGFAIDWTEQGEAAIATVYMALDELGPKNMNQILWWAVGTISMMRFRERNPGFLDFGITEL